MPSELSVIRLTILGIEFSVDFHLQYPLLHQRLYNWAHVEVQWVCLGPAGTYFAKWEGREDYFLPPVIESQIVRVKDDGITAVALGIDQTYVIVYGDTMMWNLKGHYGRLATCLEKAKSPAKVRLAESSKTKDFAD